MLKNCLIVLTFFVFLKPTCVSAQDGDRPELKLHILNEEIVIDGVLDEKYWKLAELADELKTIEPIENGQPSGRTEVRVLANKSSLFFGIICFDEQPDAIVRHSKLRDSELENEDHIRIVLDPFLDGQSGIIFSVNANGARYDALVSNRGESENVDWDAIWEAKTSIHEEYKVFPIKRN